jgi:hypothetical protein
MLPVILPVGDLSGACGWAGNEWRRIKVTEEGALVLQTYGIVFDWTATSNMTYVDVTGLDINSHWGYWIYIVLYNPTASAIGLYMFINGDYTTANYYHEYLLASGTSVSANRLNAPSITGSYAGERYIVTAFLTLAPGNYPYAWSATARRPGSSIEFFYLAWTYVSAVSNITSLRFQGSVASGIGAGTRILIYRLK